MKIASLFLTLVGITLVSCATVTITPFTYTGEKPLYPAVYQALKEGKIKFSPPSTGVDLFKDAYISKANIYDNTYTFADMYILETDAFHAIMSFGMAWYPIYLDFNVAAKGGDVTFNYSNIRLYANNFWAAQTDLPSKGKTGIPTITAFMYDSIRNTMTDGQAYSKARQEALSDPVFLRAILANMTELLREEFISKELADTKPEFTMEVVNVQKNTNPKFAQYPYYVFLAADVSKAPYEVVHSRVYASYYTNREDVARFSKGSAMKFSGKVAGIDDTSISSWTLVVQD